MKATNLMVPVTISVTNSIEPKLQKNSVIHFHFISFHCKQEHPLLCYNTHRSNPLLLNITFDYIIMTVFMPVFFLNIFSEVRILACQHQEWLTCL